MAADLAAQSSGRGTEHASRVGRGGRGAGGARTPKAAVGRAALEHWLGGGGEHGDGEEHADEEEHVDWLERADLVEHADGKHSDREEHVVGKH